MTARFLRRIGGSRSGATLVEFAMIAPALCLTLLALVDLGYRAYVASVMQGVIHEAARQASVGDRTIDQVDEFVEQRLAVFNGEGDELEIEKTSYADYADYDRPEKITSDTAPVGEYNDTDCFEDANGNGEYDTDRGRADSLGGAEDIVHYRVTLTFNRIVPLGGQVHFLGLSDTQTVSASTLMRNQPFAGRTGAAILCPAS
jgi:hypothetical protein